MMKKETVHRWYAILVFAAVLLSIAVVGAFGIVTLWNKTKRDVVTIMNLTTESKANEMDLTLLKIRDAVDTVGAYVGARVVSSNEQLDEEVIAKSLVDEIHELFQSTAENIKGAVGYYICFEQPYDALISGFAVRKNMEAETFSRMEEDGSMGKPDDQEGEGNWYEAAKAAGHPVWIPIRKCAYTDGYIFSYAVPIFFEEELVGVVCVDVDFEVLAEPVRAVSIYEHGYAYLTSDRGKVYYHPKIGYGVLLTEDEDDVPEVDAALADTSTHGKLISYEYQGQKKEMTFKSLINDMRLVVTANTEDVEREAVSLVRSIILSAIIILVVVILFALLIEKKMMHPVLDNMDDLAHLDGLTGIRNNTSFLEEKEALNRRIREGTAVFGFAMFDANNLKHINDTYGHKQGDRYLLSLVEMIRDSFSGNEIYRIGGDEFVVLLEGRARVEAADGCLMYADSWLEKRKREKTEPWEVPSAARAVVSFDPRRHQSAEDVLAEADARMYQNKLKMKGLLNTQDDSGDDSAIKKS